VRLEFSGGPEVSAPRELVWQRLIDPRFVARSAPGIESVDVLDPTHFRVTSGFGLGRIRARVTLDGELFDLVPGTSARMSLRGSAGGSAIEVISTMLVQETGNGTVRLRWSATAHISGSLANMGARLLEGVAHRLTDQFWADFALRAADEDLLDGPYESTTSSSRSR
jgi:uncharacterized protein